MSFDAAGFLRRREFMGRGAMGFGSLALASLMQDQARGESAGLRPVSPHFPPRAKQVIFLFMDGGVSHVDSFDPKPLLAKENGQKPKFQVDKTVFNNNGNILKSPWEFRNYGESGLPISDLFPHIGSCADDLCVLRSMTSFSPNHPNAVYSLHSGHILTGRPSMGAWASYGLGTEGRDLPSYVVIHGGQVPSGGMQSMGNGFLSAAHEPSIFLPHGQVLKNISPREASTAIQRRKLDFLREIDGSLARQREDSEAIRSAIRNYEMAYRMQMSVPDVADLETESKATKSLYGLDSKTKATRTYGAQCLMARRLVERGVRFIELTIDKAGGDRWDQHSKLKEGHEANAAMVDQPIAGLLKDLKSRGLLESTLVVFAGEFGRTPFAQGRDGRDHNPQGFSIWMAGGGVRGGMTYGETDEYGYRVIDKKMTVHDLHANMLHLMGMDHTQLTFRYGGRDTRLTDVHGEIIPEILV
ncbi:DUF1501 domain-containing protein [Haloferula sp.]|uniref:DUF1501 domain-containing protein n=1 Tax=Haloferula sp. TaxID=2497595 RepID=UPI003C70C48D